MTQDTVTTFEQFVSAMENAFNSSWERVNVFLRKPDGARDFNEYIEVQSGIIVRHYFVKWQGNKPCAQNWDNETTLAGKSMSWYRARKQGFKHVSTMWRNTLSGETTLHNPLT
jgi:hypothetical protein